MKLGEALALAARKAQQLDDLRGRIKANALVQEGEQPGENPKDLIDDFETISDDLADLRAQIIRTNISTEASNGDNLLELLHQRDKLRRKRNVHLMAAQAGVIDLRSMYRYSAQEVKTIPALNVQEHREIADELDNAIREIDAVVQETNWTVELVA